ncbi:hypothetical protein ACSQ67_014284 [Phaseolus vulgaris]
MSPSSPCRFPHTPTPTEYRVVATVGKQARAIIVQRKRIHRRLRPTTMLTNACRFALRSLLQTLMLPFADVVYIVPSP